MKEHSINLLLFSGDTANVLALGPMDDHDVTPHDSVFLNELKLSDFKQVLTKNNISSEFAGGVLWCANGTLALKRVREKVLFTLDFCFHRMLRFRSTRGKCLSRDVFRRIITVSETFYTNSMRSYKSRVYYRLIVRNFPRVLVVHFKSVKRLILRIRTKGFVNHVSWT